MEFGSALVKSVKADIAKKEITISFTLDIHYLEEAEELAHYVGEDKGDVAIDITPRQMQMNTKIIKTVEERSTE